MAARASLIDAFTPAWLVVVIIKAKVKLAVAAATLDTARQRVLKRIAVNNKKMAGNNVH